MSDKPRKMTGFLATLSEEQKRAALAYRGEETHGDPAFRMPLPPPPYQKENET